MQRGDVSLPSIPSNKFKILRWPYRLGETTPRVPATCSDATHCSVSSAQFVGVYGGIAPGDDLLALLVRNHWQEDGLQGVGHNDGPIIGRGPPARDSGIGDRWHLVHDGQMNGLDGFSEEEGGSQFQQANITGTDHGHGVEIWVDEDVSHGGRLFLGGRGRGVGAWV